MQIDRSQIERIVAEVVRNLTTDERPAAPSPAAPAPAAGGGTGVFPTVDDAVAAAGEAQRELVRGGMELRSAVVEAIRETGVAHAESLAQMAVDETHMGRYEHKITKNESCARYTPGVEDLTPGIFRGDGGITITEQIPFGVVCAICPVTNPTSTVINNAIMLLAAGNGVVFCPHPRAARCTTTTMSLLNDAIAAAGGPRHLLTTVAEPSLRTVRESMDHRSVSIICATGGPALVKAALEAKKRAVCAGPGNPPAIVDSTADLSQAAADMVYGASFDNNMICIAEKEFVVEESVADEMWRELRNAGAHPVSGSEANRLLNSVIRDGKPNPEFIGKHAAAILQAAGVSVNGDPPIAVVEVDGDHPLVVEEQMMPIIPFVRARCFDEAVDIGLRAEGGRHHTIVVHSRNTDHIARVLNAAKPTLFVANGPSVHGDGPPGEGYLAMTLAGPTGEGFTRPSTFTRERRYALAGGTLASSYS